MAKLETLLDEVDASQQRLAKFPSCSNASPIPSRRRLFRPPYSGLEGKNPNERAFGGDTKTLLDAP